MLILFLINRKLKIVDINSRLSTYGHSDFLDILTFIFTSWWPTPISLVLLFFLIYVLEHETNCFLFLASFLQLQLQRQLVQVNIIIIIIFLDNIKVKIRFYINIWVSCSGDIRLWYSDGRLFLILYQLIN